MIRKGFNKQGQHNSTEITCIYKVRKPNGELMGTCGSSILILHNTTVGIHPDGMDPRIPESTMKALMEMTG